MFRKKNVLNVPESAKRYKFYIARYVDGKIWYWGASNSITEANRIAGEIHGLVCY